jgi:hypothetical protein
MGNLGRQPITIVEIDFPQCSRVFGGTPCLAALSSTVAHKCFNSIATCAYLAAYDPSQVLTHRYARNQQGLPAGVTVFPALVSVSDDPGELNLSGIDPSTTALGKRDRVDVVFENFTYHDSLTDKYFAERRTGAAQFSGIGYKPENIGTHFGKLIERFPYYLGLPLRVKRGFVGDSLAAMATEHYVISAWSGPDSGGRVQITGKDVLDLADNEKAVYPEASRGKLLAAISVSDTVATLTPAGVGVEYLASGRVCIGREVMKFTRAGDVLTFTARGVDGTKASAQSINSQVQICARFEGVRICDAARTILTAGSNGVPAGYINTAEWQAEDDSWLSGLTVTTTITKPTGKTKLVGELCQLGVMIWWDRRLQKVRYRVNRPLSIGEVYYPITDAANILEGSVEIKRAEDQRISVLWMWHAMIDPTEGIESDKNFSKLSIAVQSPNLYGQDAIKQIYTRWFGDLGDDGAASVIVERLLARYYKTPKVISLSVDVKDRASVDLASLITVSSYLLETATGAGQPEPMQINMVKTTDDMVLIEAETYSITGRFGFFMQDPQGDYDTATTLEKAEGCFLMDDTIGIFPDGTGPYLMF